MKTNHNAGYRALSAALIACATFGACVGCTQEETDAVLAGVQGVVNELDSSNDEVSFRDWLSSELDD